MHKPTKLTLTSRRVLTSLYSAFGNPTKSYNALKISTLASWLDVDHKTIRSNIKLLEDINFIIRVPTPKNYKYQINVSLAKPFLLKKGAYETYKGLAKKRGNFSVFLDKNNLQKFPKPLTKIPKFDDKNSPVSIELNSSIKYISKSSSKSSSLDQVDDKRCVATQASKAATLEELIAKYGNELVTKVQARAAKYKQSNTLRYLEASLANEFTLQEQKMELRKARETPRLPAPPLTISDTEFNRVTKHFQILSDLYANYDVALKFKGNFTFELNQIPYVLNHFTLDQDLEYFRRGCKQLTEARSHLDMDEFFTICFKGGLNVVSSFNAV